LLGIQIVSKRPGIFLLNISHFYLTPAIAKLSLQLIKKFNFLKFLMEHNTNRPVESGLCICYPRMTDAKPLEDLPP